MYGSSVCFCDVLKGTIILTGKEKITMLVEHPTGEDSKDAIRFLRKRSCKHEAGGGRESGVSTDLLSNPRKEIVVPKPVL